MKTAVAVACVGLAAALACTRSTAARAERPAAPVEVAAAQAVDLVETVEVVGSLAPKLAAEVKSEYSGIVAAVHVTEWVGVRAGQPLASLDTREAEAALAAAQAAVLQAEVAETRAAREAERAASLREAGLMTQQGLEDARSARDAAAAVTAAARAQRSAAETRLAKSVIRAPFDGVIALRGVDVGDRVESMGGDAAMFHVVDNRLLELTLTVPSARLASVRAGQPVRFTVDALPGTTFEGRVTAINPSVDAQSRAARVVAQVRNGDGRLRGGLFAKCSILTGTRGGVVQVPRAALQAWDVGAGRAEVFVVRDGVAVARAIRTGAASGDAVEVVSGLAAGEQVATRGAFNLRDGDRVTPASPAAPVRRAGA